MLTSDETKNMPGMLFHALHRAHMNAVQAELHSRGLSDLGSPLILFILVTMGIMEKLPASGSWRRHCGSHRLPLPRL